MLGLAPFYVAAFAAQIDGDESPAAEDEETTAVIQMARADAEEVLTWLYKVGRL